MIVKEEFLSRLRKIFDLNLYEVKVWTALLSRGTSTAGELSNISDVPRSRTYDILESLEKKALEKKKEKEIKLWSKHFLKLLGFIISIILFILSLIIIFL